jgi:hypothetical protein
MNGILSTCPNLTMASRVSRRLWSVHCGLLQRTAYRSAVAAPCWPAARVCVHTTTTRSYLSAAVPPRSVRATVDTAACGVAASSLPPPTKVRPSAWCWSCRADAATRLFFCGQCGVIQPPPQATNYFDLFHLPARFDIGRAVLDKRYKDVQRTIHPDMFSQKSATEQGYSSRQASFVVAAYKELLHPTSRACYLVRQAHAVWRRSRLHELCDCHVCPF